MKVGLVLEGGAMRGMYTAGALDVFLDNDINVSGVIGVSAGALFGVNYVSRQRGRALRYNKKFSADKRYISIHSLIKTGDLVNKEFAFDVVPRQLDPFDDDTFINSGVPFYAVVTNIETGEAEYILIKSGFKQMETLRASGSMPFVSRPVEVNGKFYLDGAVSDAVPFKKALESGCEKIIVILTRPSGYRKKYSPLPYKLFYKEFPNFIETAKNSYKKYNETMDLIEEYEAKGKIIVLRPSELVKMKRVEKDRKKLQRMYDLGISDCTKKLDEIKEYIF